jgi:hypothetical protein
MEKAVMMALYRYLWIKAKKVQGQSCMAKDSMMPFNYKIILRFNLRILLEENK